MILDGVIVARRLGFHTQRFRRGFKMYKILVHLLKIPAI